MFATWVKADYWLHKSNITLNPARQENFREVESSYSLETVQESVRIARESFSRSVGEMSEKEVIKVDPIKGEENKMH